MQTFRYPEDYLSKRGNIRHCWEVHVKKMKKVGLPYVDYNSFYSRIKRSGWDLYSSIHTPLDTRKLRWYVRMFTWFRTQWFRFIYLFKKG